VSIVEINSANFETSTLVLRPSVIILSSSSGITGSAPIVARPSPIVKEVSGSNDLLDPAAAGVTAYLSAVAAAPTPRKNSESLSFTRIDQPVRYTANFTAKRIITEVLSDLYRPIRQNLDFGYSNYLSLSFRKSSNLPTSSVLIYPNTGNTSNRQYTPTGSFTIDFFVKPPDNIGREENYSAGTILHISSTLAISLVTGSSYGTDGNVSKFGICLQLSRSADVAPNLINLSVANGSRSHPQDLIFVSPFTLETKKWTRVTVRWDPVSDQRSGSIGYDLREVTGFQVNSASLATNALSEALFVGNFYDGVPGPGAFFNPSVAANEGLTPNLSYSSDPSSFSFRFPFYGEIHDLKIFKQILPYRSLFDYNAKGDLTGSGCCFYLPPFFSSYTRSRNTLISPFDEASSDTDSPFNVALSYDYNGYYINLENHVQEFVNREFPRLYSLTGSVYSGFALGQTADSILYRNPEVAKRNLLISNCDQSGFVRNYGFMRESDQARSYNDRGLFQDGFVSLQSLVTASYRDSILTGSARVGRYTIADRFADGSSNQVTIFSISNMLYGDRIRPGTVVLTDLKPTGSDGTFSSVLRDNLAGMLFRSDVDAPDLSNCVGNVFYEEGLVFIKSPYLSKFGKDGVKIQLEGERQSNVLVINVPCKAEEFNVSPNPTYISCAPTDAPYDEGESFVYITTMNLHDSNFNIVGRATYSQPVIKRSGQDLLFRVKHDI